MQIGAAVLMGAARRFAAWVPAALVLALFSPLVVPPSGSATALAMVGWLVVAVLIAALAFGPTAVGLLAAVLRLLLRAPAPAGVDQDVMGHPTPLLPRCRDPRLASGHRPRAPGHLG